MKWHIPAKTFLLGEYVALTGGPAILLTTKPCFVATIDRRLGLGPTDIHPDSPAGRYLHEKNITNWHLSWEDPYQGKGGLGASSAQFLAAYQAYHYVQQQDFTDEQLLQDYHQVAWNGEGMRPSGYDVLAQRQPVGCVYINRQERALQAYDWPFKDLAFILLKTQNKLATHTHLQQQIALPDMRLLSSTVELAKQAFDRTDNQCLIDAINQYHALLLQNQWVSTESIALINQLKKDPRVLAIKGCGAMGADVILLIVPQAEKEAVLLDAQNGINAILRI